MQDDIADGARWLIERGIADESRICIVGWSYGAYAALMGVAKTPDLYQCAAGVAGVYDLEKLVNEAKRFINGRYSVRHVMGWWGNKQKLRENSPNRLAGEIKSPILLVHGTHDRVADVSHSNMMHSSLEKNGRKSDYVRLAEGDHSLRQGENRVKMLSELESFLGRHIGR